MIFNTAKRPHKRSYVAKKRKRRSKDGQVPGPYPQIGQNVNQSKWHW